MSKEGNDPNKSTHSEGEEFKLSLSKKDEKYLNNLLAIKEEA